MSFDIEIIKDVGLVTETPVIITNQDAYIETITGTHSTTIQAGEALMVATRI
ncbi:trehalose PTS system, IIABC components [Streptococcus pneumoniae]|uniref:Trehalose PTS system, IIABC components n=1 Tax=Streptococcus pneumoniae TaxID=1313 RepID=A0A4M9XRR2_STREE|nr:trehalose PTS system, IIABC components [Streptococcus pneumoniae]